MQKYIWIAIFTTALGISSEFTEMQKACERKMPTACYELGQLYEEGLGVDKVKSNYLREAFGRLSYYTLAGLGSAISSYLDTYR